MTGARGGSGTMEIERAMIAATTVVTLRGSVPAYEQEGQLWARFEPELRRQGVRVLGPGGVFEHVPEEQEDAPELSVFLPVAPGTVVAEPLSVVDVPEQEAVVARIVGPYDLIPDAHQVIGEYMNHHGLVDAEPDGLAGLVHNVYLSDPAQVPEDERVTEVRRPVRT